MNKTHSFLLLISFLTFCTENPKINNKKSNNFVSSKNKDSTKIITTNLTINKNFVLGKFNYKVDTTFVKVSTKHSSKSIYLKNETYAAFKKMHRQAQKEDITLTIISGTRNFYEQKYIWERKWKKYNYLNPKKRAEKILEYSSMPSTSRHHWGTDIDLINLNNSYFEKGRGKKEHDWLVKNANNFGFYQVYTNKKNGRTGYNLEKWHWSYLPLAAKYLNYYNNNISYKNINGFKGAEFAEKVNIITNYVNGISEKSKKFK